MASVWLAYDQVLERDVAVKVPSDTIAYDPDFVARFRREAKVAAGLTHRHLIGVWDYADGEERPYLVMEYVAGETLAERMSGERTIDSERLARELLGALAHIHAAGIVHRDVKPQNILLGDEGEAKLIDFGIALPDNATALTQTGQLLGTARYLAPEVMSGAPATQRSDLYSCGIVLRDCLGGDPSRELRSLVARLTSAEPRDRPASAEAALAALGEAGTSPEPPTELFEPTEEFSPVRPAPPRRPPPSGRGEPRRSSRAWGRIAAVAALLLTVGAVGALVLADGGDDGRRAEVSPVAAADADEGEQREPAPAPEPESEPNPEPEPEPEPESTGEADPARGSALNQEGFEMIQAGQYEEAVPVLEEAVASFPAESEELEYGYALFNLGNALRLSGRPEEAIAVLERRLEIPDQIDVVRRELAAAESDAGR